MKATNLAICVPVFNDWNSARKVLERLDNAFAGRSECVSVLLVDDGSYAPLADAVTCANLAVVDVLTLRRNLGHQRAIAIGLCHIYETGDAEVIAVMDGDGEDRPEDVPKLLKEFYGGGGAALVFAQRGRRFEGPAFRACYLLYRALFRVLIGREVRGGNFCVMPIGVLARLVGTSEVWNHFASALSKLPIPIGQLKLDRGRRISGGSNMPFTSLVMHGLSSISVFAEIVGLRLLLVTVLLGVTAFAALVVVICVKYLTTLAIPGWATYAAGLAVVVILQRFLLSFVFVFIVLQGRNHSQFLPLRDYSYFVAGVTRVAGAK